MSNSREFVCDDCKTNVFEFGDGRDVTLCHGCETIREMKAKGLTPKQEADLREILHCQLPSGDDAGVTK
jgi:hypothetical protein